MPVTAGLACRVQMGGAVAEMPDRSMPEGRYANCFEVGVSDVEVVIDFGQQYGRGAPHFHTRIITSPAFVGDLLKLLTESLGSDPYSSVPEGSA